MCVRRTALVYTFKVGKPAVAGIEIFQAKRANSMAADALAPRVTTHH